MGNKKLSVNIEVLPDSTFSLEFSQGMMNKKRGSAETVESVVQKVGLYLRNELTLQKG